MTENRTRNIAGDIAGILKTAIGSHLPRGEYSAYKAVKEAYGLLLLGCLIFTSMFADGLLSGGEALRAGTSFIQDAITGLGFSFLACRLLFYILEVFLRNESVKVARITSYAVGASYAASGLDFAARLGFVNHIAESMGVGRLLFLYVFGFLFAMIFARIFEIIICVALAKIEKICEEWDGAI